MSLLNRRFRDRFVPISDGTVTHNGTMPVNQFRQLNFAIQLEQSNNLLTLSIPWPIYGHRKNFFTNCTWNPHFEFTKLKRNKKFSRKLYKTNGASWSASVTI